VENDEIGRLIATLSAREEEALLLRLQGFRYQEIASALHVKVNSVKTLLARALRKLHDHANPGSGDLPRLSTKRFVRFREYVTKTFN
jgi:DNA-directed RNA polymerase specialized sigma24 family protein